MLSEQLQALIIREIRRALSVQPVDDPLLGPEYGYLHRVLASLLRRGGVIIEAALREILHSAPHLVVLDVDEVRVAAEADRAAATCDLATALKTHFRYEPGARRIVKPDFLVLRLNDVCGQRGSAGHLDIVECKRGGGRLCSSALTSMTRNLLALQMQSLSFAAHLGLGVGSTRAMVISVYGKSGSDSALTVKGHQMDDYFGYDVSRRLDEVLQFLRDELHRHLPPPSAFLKSGPFPHDPEGPDPRDGDRWPGRPA